MPEETAKQTGSGPLIQLGAGERAPVLSYDVPQPAEYTGRNYIELEFDNNIWSEGAYKRPDAKLPPRPKHETGELGETIIPDEFHEKFDKDDLIAWEDSPDGFPPEVWIEYAAGFTGEQVIVSPDGGVEVSDREAIGGDAVLDIDDGSLVLTVADRHRLSEALFEGGGFETIAESNPELLPGVLKALALPVRMIEADEIDLDADAPTADTPADSSGEVRLRELISDDSAYASLVDRYSEPVVKAAINDGWRIRERLNFAGKKVYDQLLPPGESGATPRLALVETYKLSSFLGDYGAGQTIQTFSLLPGERHDISVRTYRNSKSTRSEASSILDSYEEETATEFGEQLHDENSRKDNETENFSYHAEAKAEASWGWGSAEVSGGVAGGSTATRESFAKDVASTTSKHAAKAASKRNIQVNTTTEDSIETGEERSVTRSIENINLSRTLNFVFRQMNQEFISLLHLVDVRVAFHNGDKSAYREVAIHELDRLLDDVIDADHRDEVRRTIWDSLYFVFDYEGEHTPFIERRVLADADGNPFIGFDDEPLLNPETEAPPGYWRIPPVRSTFRDSKSGEESSGLPITIDGVILRATVLTLPTDGVIVEALLGQGEALDDYSSELQDEAVREKRVASDQVAANVELEALRRRVVENDDAEAAELLAKLYPVDDGAEETPTPVEG